MYTTDIDKIKDQLSEVLSVVDPVFVETLISLHERLDKESFEWAIGGELGEALRAVQGEPDCIEIVTSKEGADRIFLAFKEESRNAAELQIQKIGRNASVNGKEHQVYVRSYYLEFFLGCVRIKVFGDMQYKIDDWDWGDKLEFQPEYVYVAGVKTAVVPLQIKQEIYQNLGWSDRAEKIEHVISKGKESL
jgi:hypothetical protein